MKETLLSDGPSPPRLLVSVRNLDEARIARAAGSDLIDLKEPRSGSLGMAEIAVAESIASQLPPTNLSLALGELGEWKKSRQVPVIPAAFQFLKLGLSRQAGRDWIHDWRHLRDTVNERSGKSFQWIAVVYADFDTAKSPAPDFIIRAAQETGCAGVLFDTWSKSGGSLTDHLSHESLKSCIERIHTAGMLAALAGSLREEHLPALLPLGADVIAVRGAVCGRFDRTAAIDAESIVIFKQRLIQPVESLTR